MISAIFLLEDIFNLSIQRTVYLSDTMEQNPIRVDLVPLTEDHRDLFNTLAREAANAIWMKLGKYATSDEDTDYPFVFNTETDGEAEEYPGSIVYILDEPANFNTKVHTPMLVNSIQSALMHYVVYRWMVIKGLAGEMSTLQEYQEYNDCMSLVDRTMSYGGRPKLIYRTF